MRGKHRYALIAAAIGIVALVTTLPVLIPELLNARGRREFSALDLTFAVGVDSVRAIRVRPDVWNFLDSQYMVEVECDREHFDLIVERYRMKKAGSDEGPVLRHMAWTMATWWPVLLRRPEIYTTPDLEFDLRGADGLHFAAFYDDPSKSMYLWVKNNF